MPALRLIGIQTSFFILNTVNIHIQNDQSILNNKTKTLHRCIHTSYWKHWNFVYWFTVWLAMSAFKMGCRTNEQKPEHTTEFGRVHIKKNTCAMKNTVDFCV